MALAPKILIVAGTDPTGGAGIVRDIETASHFGVKTGLAITSVNVQDNHRVEEKLPMPRDIIHGQMRAALRSEKISAIKIGMTGTAEIVCSICDVLDEFSSIPVILDPVITASSGGALADNATIAEIQKNLLKHCLLITPNLFELARLTGTVFAKNHEETIEQAKKLVLLGACYVLAKGGHESGDISTDSLVSSSKVSNFSCVRLNAVMRGTGCTLSTAIACELANGKHIEGAVESAKAYVYQLLKDHITQNSSIPSH